MVLKSWKTSWIAVDLKKYGRKEIRVRLDYKLPSTNCSWISSPQFSKCNVFAINPGVEQVE